MESSMGNTFTLSSFQNCDKKKKSMSFNISETFNKNIHSESKTSFLPHTKKKKQNMDLRKAQTQPECS